MELNTVVTLIIIAVLLFAFAAAMFWSIRRYRNLTRAHEDERQETAEAHRVELEQNSTDRQNREAELRARNEATDTLRKRAVRATAQGMKWDLISRHQIVNACESAGLDAVIATNIVFTPAEQAEHAFCAQIDHLVITSNAVLIIESKHWSGVIFDGIRPSAHAAALSVLFDENAMIAPFAVQIAEPQEGSQVLESRVSSGKKAPARQARKQAMRFRGLLQERSKTVPYIDTCVFYSHQRSKVITRAFDQEGTARTVIATSDNIHRIISDVHKSKQRRLGDKEFALVIATVRELGADLVGTGSFAETYQSPVPLGFKIRNENGRAPRRS